MMLNEKKFNLDLITTHLFSFQIVIFTSEGVNSKKWRRKIVGVCRLCAASWSPCRIYLNVITKASY